MQKILLAVFALTSFSFVNINQQYSSQSSLVNVSSLDNSSPALKLTRTNFEDSVKRLYDHIDLESYNLNYNVFKMGMIGFHSLRNEGKVGNRNLLTIIDFTKPSTEKRFYTIDLDAKKVKFHSLVAHGRTTGENMAKTFSNKPHSNASSLGFYVTGETYVGSKGYSLRLDGQEKKYNGNIRSRAVVIHSADYVSESWIRKNGRIGRSQGCPALPNEINKAVINTIKNKTVIFAYYKDDTYLKSSAYLDFDKMIDGLETRLAENHTGLDTHSSAL
jgi:hypothetical protein